MSTQDENEAISALTGFSLNHILTDLSLPSGSGLSNQLGISGNPSLNSSQIYGDKWDEDGAVGPGQGEDWEDEVDRELEAEDFDEPPIKMELDSPKAGRQKQKRVRVIKRLVERPKTVYERFPAFEKNKVLDFSELFKGYTGKKSRLVKKPFHRESCPCIFNHLLKSTQLKLCTPGKERFQRAFWRLSWEIREDKLRADAWRK